MKIHIDCNSETTGDGGLFRVSTFDSRGGSHKKKQLLRGDRPICIGSNYRGNRLTLGGAIKQTD